jgi:hypothetical protein
MKELMKAAFSIIGFHDYRDEVILEKPDADTLWSLTQYEHYCSGHARSTPWHFFPRYLSQKEFVDPYKALKKFTQYRSLAKWKYTLKELLHHALSSTGINEFNGSTGIIHTCILLHKLIEASHLIAIRINAEPEKPNKLKWKKKEETEILAASQNSNQ